MRGPHVYVKRPDGSSGYEPAPIQEVILPSPEVAQEVLETLKKVDEAFEKASGVDTVVQPKKAAWGTAKTK